MSEQRSPSELASRYQAVRQRIADAAARAGRDSDSVHLVAVTKYASLAQVRELIELGHCDFGESRMQHLLQISAQVQEHLDRRRELGHVDGLTDRVRWHFIGHLQRNKVRRIQPLCRLIHSVDSLRLAEEIQAAAREDHPPTEVLVQVNVDGERGKHGVAPAAAEHLIDQMTTMPDVRVRGLMCMGPQSEDPEATRPVFERAYELFDDIRRSAGLERFDVLSMGMTQDFEVAIECGANVVRVGSAIFGTPDPDAVEAEAAEAS
ncbi:MAG: YggS family pyridoxal phosphate-dependent enzyme [Phycisphaerales bacterium]|nr:YggS family pyridoxal phosphate-dependent enzyme [Phycisphaerales bacterium]